MGIIEIKELINRVTDGIAEFGNYILTAAGAVVVVMLIWGGLQYTQNNAEGGKKTIIAALIGLAIIVLASVIVQLVVGIGGFTG